MNFNMIYFHSFIDKKEKYLSIRFHMGRNYSKNFCWERNQNLLLPLFHDATLSLLLYDDSQTFSESMGFLFILQESR